MEPVRSSASGFKALAASWRHKEFKDIMGTGIAIIGCGRMGSAIAKTLAKAGEVPVVWDISAESLSKIAGTGVRSAKSLDDVVKNAAILIFCLPSYDDVAASLEAIPSLDGVIVVNLGEGTARQAEAILDTVAASGGSYLDGEILTPPDGIGTNDNIILISGDAGSWETVRPRIGVLAGDFRYVSSDIGASCALVLGVMGSFVVAGAVALMEGARYARSNGVKVEQYMELLGASMPIFEALAREGFAAMDSGDYRSDETSIEIGFHSAETFICGLKEQGFRADMLEVAQRRFREGIDDGIGQLMLFALDRD